MRACTAAIAAGGVGLLALGLAMASPGTAKAAEIIKLAGNCSDCTGQGVGTLTLANLPSGQLTKADFLNFAYKSNLLSFDISSADIVAVVGSIDPNNLGKSYIDILQLGGTGWEFIRNSDGTWSVSSQLTHGEGTQKGPGGAMVAFGGGGGGGGSSSFGTGGGAQGGFGPGVGGSFGWSSHDGGGTDDFGSSSSVTDEGPGNNDSPGDDGHGGDQVTAVPEPASWALMLLGFAGVGGVIRRGRRTFSGIETA